MPNWFCYRRSNVRGILKKKADVGSMSLNGGFLPRSRQLPPQKSSRSCERQLCGLRMQHCRGLANGNKGPMSATHFEAIPRPDIGAPRSIWDNGLRPVIRWFNHAKSLSLRCGCRQCGRSSHLSASSHWPPMCRAASSFTDCRDKDTAPKVTASV